MAAKKGQSSARPGKGKGMGGGAAAPSLEELVSFTRAGAAGDNMDANYAQNILRLGTRFKGMRGELDAAGGSRTGADEDDDCEVDMQLFQGRSFDVKDMARAHAQAASQARRMEDVLARCSRCLGSQTQQGKGVAVVATGAKTYLRVVSGARALAPGHCEIVTLEHVPSLAGADEGVWLEITRWKSCLERMFEREGMRVVFLEAAVRLGSHPHCCVHAVPLPPAACADTRLYFRSALLECDDEWTSKPKIIELTAKQPAHRSVPPHFEYVHVEWGVDLSSGSEGGGADDSAVVGAMHVVEDSSKFGPDFLLDVLCGQLEQDTMRMRGRSAPGVDARASAALKKLWEPFDWTQYV
jgi:hypothetical protein